MDRAEKFRTSGVRVSQNRPSQRRYISRTAISGFPKIRGTFWGSPFSKDCSISGSKMGLPIFWEVTISMNQSCGCSGAAHR